MDLKETFLASLSDEQLGFFCAHEYNENLADMLQDEINVIQYQLFEKWKEHEKIIVAQNPVPSSLQPDFTDKMSQLFEMFAERIEAKMEEKIKALEESYSEKLASIEQQIVQVSTSQKHVIEKVNELEGSISQQFAYIKQKIEESEQHLTEKSDQLAEKVFDCIKNSIDWKILNERVNDIYYNTFTIPTMTVEEAIEWLKEILTELYNKRYECIKENTVKKVIGIMKKFENNDSIVKTGIDILERMTRNSDMTVHYITNTHGGIENLMKLFTNSDCRNNDLYRILIRIVECKETQKKLMTSEYLSLIFEQLSKERYTRFVLYYSIILSHLLDFSEDSFPVNITKNVIESKIIERLPKISTDYIPSYILPHDYSWYLDRIINGTKAQKYICAIVVYSAIYDPDCKKHLIDAGAIPILERVLSDANADNYVKKKVDEALGKLKK